MQYSKEHISKCAGCPKMKGCKALEIEFKMRVYFCIDLDKYKPKLDTLISRCSPGIKAMLKDDPYTGFLANRQKDLSKHYTPEAIEAGKRRYDRTKPTDYLSPEAGKILMMVCNN